MYFIYILLKYIVGFYWDWMYIIFCNLEDFNVGFWVEGEYILGFYLLCLC